MERRFSLIKRYYVFLILLLISTGVFACQRETREKPDSLSLIVKNGKYGYIDRTGKIVITSQFDGAWQFSGGLALVKVGDKWGYIDRSGKMVIKPQFDAAESFFEGSAKLIIGGCIDKAGRMVINAQFDDAESVTSGLARVSNGDKSNYIDKEGKYVLGPTNQFQLKRSGDSPLKGPYESRQVPADDSRQRTFTGHLNIDYDAVMACIGDAESILTFGPGEAKGELKKRLDKKGVGGRIAGIETVD